MDRWKDENLTSVESKELFEEIKSLDGGAGTSKESGVSDVNQFIIEPLKYPEISKNTAGNQIRSQNELDFRINIYRRIWLLVYLLWWQWLDWPQTKDCLGSLLQN